MRYLIVLLLFLVPASAAKADQIELFNPSEIDLAISISDALDTMTEYVSACIGDGSTRQECLCLRETDLDWLRENLDHALTRHPEWRGQSLYVRDPGDGQALTLFLDAIATASAPPNCG